MHALIVDVAPAELEAVSARLWAAGCLGLEEQPGRLVAYFADRLEGLPGRWESVGEEDWSTAWRRGIKPLSLGSIEIWPSWIQGAPPGAILLDPGRAFGTGHHATTRLALEAMQSWVLKGRSFLDVGTGSGVLALAACRLGASRVLGLDPDPVAIEVARENALNNRARARFRVGELSSGATLPRSYAVVANLYADAIIAGAGELARAVTAQGRLAVTGLLADQAAPAAVALVEAGLALHDRRDENGWTLLEFVKAAR